MDGDKLNVTATPFPQANSLLAVLLQQVPPILGDNFAGMYLFGSLALGDFDWVIRYWMGAGARHRPSRSAACGAH